MYSNTCWVEWPLTSAIMGEVVGNRRLSYLEKCSGLLRRQHEGLYIHSQENGPTILSAARLRGAG